MTYLAHYGVKGMKWGVRKKYYKSYMDKDFSINKGESLQNISNRKYDPSKFKGGVYTARTAKDKATYKSWYADYLSDKPVYVNDLKVTDNIRVPSQRKAVELFVQTLQSDPKRMNRSLNKAIKDQSLLGFGVGNKYVREARKSGSKWLETKGYLKMNEALVSKKGNEFKKRYYKTLMDNGYDALLDVNDIQSGQYNSEQPLIIINQNKLSGQTKKLMRKDINAAYMDYASKYSSDREKKAIARMTSHK